MRRLLITGLMLVLLPLSMARASDLTLNYQAVMHVDDANGIAVFEDDEHLIGTGAFSGIAIFGEDDIARHQYVGFFDLTDGSGAFHGYALWTFDDGSTLRARYDGSVRQVAPDDAEVSAAFHDFSGTGRFAKATGTGRFEGRRFEAVTEGGATYLKGTLSLSTGG